MKAVLKKQYIFFRQYKALLELSNVYGLESMWPVAEKEENVIWDS